MEGRLRHLRAHWAEYAEEVRLLEIDLALFSEHYDRAASLLEQHRKPLVVEEDATRPAADRLREARLALGRHQATLALEAASQALMLSHQAGAQWMELEALLVMVEAQQKWARARKQLEPPNGR